MPLPLARSTARHQASRIPSSPHHSRLASTASPHPRRTIALVGGGISGLTAAHRLASRLPPSRYNILLLEQSQRLGGWIHSHRVPLPSPSSSAHSAQSALVEKGPRSIRPAGNTALVMLRLIRSLGLLDRMLKVPKSAPSAQNRFIYYPDRLAKLPSSLPSLLTALAKLPFLRAALPRAALEFRVPSRFARPKSESQAEQKRQREREALQDESVDAFVARRFGQGIAANLVSAVIHGIYAGDSRKLSIRSVMPALWDAERTHGSVLKSMLLKPHRNKSYRELPEGERAAKQRKEAQAKEAEERLGKDLVDSFKGISVYSFPNGLQEIVDALDAQLQASENVEVRRGAGVESIVVGENGKVILQTTEGEKVEADRVISALPASALSQALHAGGAEELPGLDFNPSANVGVVNIVISPTAADGSSSSTQARLPVEGFGYLIPRTTPNNEDGILGVVFDSDSLPTQDLPDPLSGSADATAVAERPIKLTVMMGGAHWSSLDHASLPTPEEMRERAIRAVSHHLSIPASLLQDSSRTTILPTLQRDCIPQYLVGHPIRMAALHRALHQHPTLAHKLTLVGASYTGVSLNDCAAYAIETADRIVEAELQGQSGQGKAVTGLENFDNSPSPLAESRAGSSIEAIGADVVGAPPLSGAVQRMVRSGQAWLRGSAQLGGQPAFGGAVARGLHTSAARRNTASPSSTSTSTGADATATKKPRPLGEVLAESIRASGPMPVSTYMRTCLLDPMQGYYSRANAESTSPDDVSREVLGSRGDFITSPEISQVFGELIAIFYLARWQACGSPRRTRLVELGPGKGTLLADMLRTFAVFPPFMDSIESIHLVETSEGLMKLQLDAVKSALERAGGGKKKLVPADQAEVGPDEIRIEWFNDISDVPLQPEVFTILTAHEFFDALPTHVFEKTVNGWREVLVGVKPEEGKGGQKGITVLRPADIASHKLSSTSIGGDKKTSPTATAAAAADEKQLQFVLSPGPTPWSKLLAEGNKRFATVQPGQRVEVSPESWAVARRVGEILSGRPAASPPRIFASSVTENKDEDAGKEEEEREKSRLSTPSTGGVSLLIDYGGDQAFSHSLRAFRRHEIVDVFTSPGQCDLTVNVDFVHLRSALLGTETRPAGEQAQGKGGLMDQADFLMAMGLEQRVEKLRRDAKDEERRRAIESATNRIIDHSGMGRQYKFLALVSEQAEGGFTEEEVEGKMKRRLKTKSAGKLYPFEM